MAIPELNDDGLLPAGIHSCTLEELKEKFGRFQRTDCRLKLVGTLEALLQEMQSTKQVVKVFVDGSFVTGKDDPNDIDLVAVVHEDYDVTADLRPFEYNALSKRMVGKRYKFDMFLARQNSAELTKYVEFFQQVRNNPDQRKGILMLELQS